MSNNRNVMLILSIYFIFIFRTASSTTCTRSCTTGDKTLDCWTQSVDHFTEEAVRNIDRFARIVLQFAKWQHKNPTLSEENNNFITKEVNKAIENYVDDAVLNHTQLHDIMDILVDKAQHLVAEWEEQMPPPLMCPIPCSYTDTVWRNLFFFMLTITILTIFTLSVYVFCFVKPTKDGKTLKCSSCFRKKLSESRALKSPKTANVSKTIKSNLMYSQTGSRDESDDSQVSNRKSTTSIGSLESAV